MPRRRGSKYAQRPGEVYIIDFHTRLHHAGHYVGFAEYDLDGKSTLAERLGMHSDGTGSKLLKAVRENGIEYSVVLVLPSNQAVETLLHHYHRTDAFCPKCLLVKYGGNKNRVVKHIAGGIKRMYNRAGVVWNDNMEQIIASFVDEVIENFFTKKEAGNNDNGLLR